MGAWGISLVILSVWRGGGGEEGVGREKRRSCVEKKKVFMPRVKLENTVFNRANRASGKLEDHFIRSNNSKINPSKYRVQSKLQHLLGVVDGQITNHKSTPKENKVQLPKRAIAVAKVNFFQKKHRCCSLPRKRNCYSNFSFSELKFLKERALAVAMAAAIAILLDWSFKKKRHSP